MKCQKEKFSLPDGITYLNCAYMGPSPKAVEHAGVQSLTKKSAPWAITVPDFFEPGERVKSLFAQLVGVADPERVAIVPSVSYGMATVVKNISPRPGQNIVLLHEEFPSNFYAWKRLADESGAHLRIVAPQDTLVSRGEKWNDKLLQNIDSQTVAVSMPHVHWADGTLFNLVAVGVVVLGEVGALLIIDGTQSVGALPFDVGEIQPDALICAGYKWLFGAYGTGLAYFWLAFDGGVPLEENWINRLNSENFQQLVNYQPAYKPGANRYCMGENSQFVGLAMLGASIEMLLGWGPENIQHYCREITAESLGRLSELGVWSEEPGWRGHHLFGLRLPEGTELERLKARAAAEKILVSFRGSAVRVAPHVFNEKKDLEKLAAAIEACL